MFFYLKTFVWRTGKLFYICTLRIDFLYIKECFLLYENYIIRYMAKNMVNFRKIESNFEKLRAGVAFFGNQQKQMKFAFRLIHSLRKEWDYVTWISPRASLKARHYIGMIKDCAGEDLGQLLFFPQEHISACDRQYLKLCSLSDHHRLFCVIDDSISIKNAGAALTKRLQALRNKFSYRLLLSKNPLTSSIKDIYVQMSFVNPQIFNMTETQFLHNFMPLLVSEYDMAKRWSDPGLEKKAVDMVRPYVLACDFKNNLHIVRQEYWFELTPQEKKSYQEDKEHLLQGVTQNGYLSVSQNFQYYYTLCRQKVEALQKILSEISARKEKVIIYLKYSGEINFLEETGLLDAYQYVIMAGRSNKNRASLLFEVDYDIMICTYKVKIPRLNLHECANLIYFTQTFDYKDKLYILSKFYDSKRKKLRIYDFWVNTKLENLIRANLERKRKLLKNVCEIMSRDCC